MTQPWWLFSALDSIHDFYQSVYRNTPECLCSVHTHIYGWLHAYTWTTTYKHKYIHIILYLHLILICCKHDYNSVIPNFTGNPAQHSIAVNEIKSLIQRINMFHILYKVCRKLYFIRKLISTKHQGKIDTEKCEV